MSTEQEKQLIAKYGISRVQYRNLRDRTLIYDVDPSNFDGVSPSQFLANKIQGRVQLLLERGFGRTLIPLTSEKVELWNNAGISQIGTVFMWAAISGDFDLLVACHERERDVINYNLFDILPEFLNARKPRVNALHLAALSGSGSCVEHLLNNGCKYISELESNSEEWNIIKYSLLPFMRFDKPIIDFIDQFSPAHLAILGNHIDILNMFIRRFRHTSDWFSHTCLHATTLSDAISCLRRLIEWKILNPADAYNQNGMTVYHLAAGGSHILVLNLIKLVFEEVPKAVDWITRNGKRETALHIAAESKQESIVKYLIFEEDANPTIKDSSGKSAIYYIRSRLKRNPSDIICQRLDSTLSQTSNNELSIHVGYLLKHSNPVDGDLSFLKRLLCEENVNVLQHPCSLALLESKWKYLRPYLYWQAVMSILWVFVTSSLILQTVKDQCPERNNTNNDDFQTSKVSKEYPPYSFYYILLAANLLPIIIFIKGYDSWKEYIFNKHNILQTSFVTCSSVFFHFSPSCDLLRWSGILAVMTGWFMVSSSIGQLSWLFIEQCTKVYMNMLKTLIFILAFSFPLWVAFLFSFCMLRPSLFENLLLGLIRILEMAVGEEDMDDIWQKQPGITIFISSSFILLVNISLIGSLPNLVEDKPELQKEAKIDKITRKMTIILFYEKVYRRKLYLPFYSICLSDLLMPKNFLYKPYKEIYVDRNDPRKSSEEIPRDIFDAAIKITSEKEA